MFDDKRYGSICSCSHCRVSLLDPTLDSIRSAFNKDSEVVLADCYRALRHLRSHAKFRIQLIQDGLSARRQLASQSGDSDQSSIQEAVK
jgi:hypothetical protein